MAVVECPLDRGERGSNRDRFLEAAGGTHGTIAGKPADLKTEVRATGLRVFVPVLDDPDQGLGTLSSELGDEEPPAETWYRGDATLLLAAATQGADTD